MTRSDQLAVKGKESGGPGEAGLGFPDWARRVLEERLKKLELQNLLAYS
jgi:hypothetical protein